MRILKKKRHRRAVRFYTACYGFRQPFKVLCDGTFVHHLIVNHIAPADKAVSNLLGGPVKLFTTRCVLAELKRLGNSYSESLQAAHKLMIARCDHEKIKNADACFMEVIGEDNPDHFFIATQDNDLRQKTRQLAGVPLIFGLRNSLFLEPPSASQRKFAKTSEEERSHMTELERKMLKKRPVDMLENEATGDSSHENESSGASNLKMQPVMKTHIARKGVDIKDRPLFKRKKARGPNPLSVKKKKKPENMNPSSEKESVTGGNVAVRSRKRKRKRASKGKAVEMES